MLVFHWFRCFVGSPRIWGLFLASCWPLAVLFLASCWPLAGFLLAFCWRLAGLLLTSCWPLAGLLLASCWPLLVSCWPLVGACLLLASWLLAGFKLRHENFSRKSVFTSLAKPVNSLHENICFSIVSVFRVVPLIWGLFLTSCWPLAGLLLASCWLLAGVLLASLASCWPLPGFSCWPLAGFLLASSFPTRISLENRFFKRLPKLVNSLHENVCFSMVSVFRGVPPIWGLFLASCWPLPGRLLASPPEYPARAPRQSSPPEHPARASRQSTPSEHPARASRQSTPLREILIVALRQKTFARWLRARLAGVLMSASR